VSPDDDSFSPLQGAAAFATTRWSVVLLAAEGGEGEAARRSLEVLCRSYWYPIYAYIRRSGHSPHDAQDLTQGFFTFVLEKQLLAKADPTRGRFRSFLLGAARNFLGNEWQKERAAKRGGAVPFVSLDAALAEQRLAVEPATVDDPETIFERAWAVSVIELALERLTREQAAGEKAQMFEKLRPSLAGAPTASYAELAAEFGSTEGAMRVAVHRLRQRYRELLRATIADTVEDPREVEAELQHLQRVLSR
jgi:RNA polymerase sigma-70 factor (ECF subfamily)